MNIVLMELIRIQNRTQLHQIHTATISGSRYDISQYWKICAEMNVTIQLKLSQSDKSSQNV